MLNRSGGVTMKLILLFLMLTACGDDKCREGMCVDRAETEEDEMITKSERYRESCEDIENSLGQYTPTQEEVDSFVIVHGAVKRMVREKCPSNNKSAFCRHIRKTVRICDGVAEMVKKS